MMKGGFEVIRPHEQLWDHKYANTCTNDDSNIGFPMVGIGSNSVANPSSVPAGNSNNRVAITELSHWVEHVTRQLIEDLTESTEDELAPSDSAGDLNNTMLKFKDGLMGGSYQDNIIMENDNKLGSNKGEKDDDDDKDGMRLISLLMECAVAISVDNLGEAHRMLLELTQMASPYGLSCAERIVAYFGKAMTSRVVNSWIGICTPLINLKTLNSTFQLFNNISPFIKFAHFTSNQAILEAVHRSNRVHIIDLDIMQGLQWPALFHILATRPEGPPHLKMTGLGPSVDLLAETGKQLSNFAKRLGLSFEFHPVARKFGEIEDVSALQIRRGEAVAVHWLQHSLYDATGPDYKTMKLLHQISPTVITLVEQEISHGGSFLDRFVGSLHYYSTVFDSIGALMPSDDLSRHTVEHFLLHREINNILAIGGPARSGEDKYRQWRSELLGNGFLQVGMSRNSIAQAQLILNMFPPSHGYSLVQGDGTLKLGWKETSLYTASAWTSPVTPRV